jgi:hypothetical protein
MADGLTLAQIGPMRGKDVRAVDGKKLGTIDAIFYDGLSDHPEWVEVKTGIFSAHHYLVPLQGASIRDKALVLGFARDVVVGQPKFDSMSGLTEQVESATRAYFHIDQPKRQVMMQVIREGDWATGPAR